MNILKYKYKAHKLINYLFYIIIFFIGFGLGFGVKKIDFSKLISQFLMIDNVSAYTSTSVNENTILEKFQSAWSDFSIIDYPYISCYTNSNSASAYLICTAIDEETFNSLYIDSVSNSQYGSADIYGTSGHNIYRLVLNPDLSIYANTHDSGTNYLSFNWNSSKTHSFVWTNYDFDKVIDNSSNLSNTQKNNFKNNYKSSSHFITLDFSSYLVPEMVYNENLFKDNPNFKQVCVENNKVFAITRATNSEVNEYFDYDYIWFPFGLDGLAKGLYDSSLDDKFSYYTEQDTFGYYWFKNKENIDNYFNNDIPGLELEMKGYTNKYSYYGWSAHYFRMYFEGGNTQFTIFKFVNPTTLTYNDETNTNHGGGGLRLDGDEEIQISNNYCFYVKNEYEVQYINVDEWGDYYGTVITPNGDYDFNTSYNKNNSNTDNFLSQPISFINSMKDTINFINSLIYELYISLPVLLRTFIITLLIILIIMLIMRIGGYK